LATYTPQAFDMRLYGRRGEVKIERLLKWIGKSRDACVDVHIEFSIEMAKKVMLEKKARNSTAKCGCP
jgi:hypothetical protein